MSRYGPYACWGYCIHLDQAVAEALEFNIQKLVSWIDPIEGYEKELKEVADCPDFIDAVGIARCHFGDGIHFETEVDGQKLSGYIYYYDPDYGGVEDDLQEGLYLEFQQADLYTMRPKPAFNKLKELGAKPDFCTWVVNT